ncbi:uncharacterized protein [Rutidosis leptorrhynchoides]|uniref:uncharacterized protein n=1 Tax=Rutidosis leptorrhynchoides TaxID=125765 RepID=UPI003A994BFA
MHRHVDSVKFPINTIARASSSDTCPPKAKPSSSSSSFLSSFKWDSQFVEQGIERVIYASRFLTLMAVVGSLLGSLLCFVKGCTYIVASFTQYFADRAKVIILLVEAIDTYLLGTVMLVFGMGLYELFVSNLDIAKEGVQYRSNLFGLFTLKERPRWLDVKTVSELKTKVGHVIVMLLLIGLFDKSKRASIQSAPDLLCFSASVLLSSGSLFLLSKLTE